MSEYGVTLRVRGDAAGGREALRQIVDESKKASTATATAARPASSAVDEVGNAGSRTAKKLRSELRPAADEASGSLTRLKGQAKEVFAGVLAGAGVAGFAAGLFTASTASRQFGAAWAEVTTLLSDTNGIEAQRDALLDLSTLYGSSGTEQAKAYYQAISSGAQAGAGALGLLSTANKLAIGGITQTSTAVDGLTSVTNAYGRRVAGAADVSDTLFVGMRAGKTTIDELANSIGQVAPLAATVGVEFTELVSSISAITLGGVKTSEAVTQVRAVLASVIRPTADAAKTAEELGLDFSTAAIRAKGFEEFMREIVTATNGNEQALAKLFPSIEGLSGALSLTGTQAGAFSSILEQMEGRAGATDAAFAKMSETADQQLKRGLEAVRLILMNLGNTLNEVVAPAASFVADNVGAISAALEIGLSVGALYLGMFVVVPAMYNAITVAGWRMVAMLTAKNASLASSITSMGAVRVAGMSLLAAFTGWQIGTELREQFLEVRLFGIAMVQGLLDAWERLKFGAALSWEFIKFKAIEAFDTMRAGIADVLNLYVRVAEASDVFGIGEDVIAKFRSLEEGIRGPQNAAKEFGEEAVRLRDQLVANTEAIATSFNDAADYEIQAELAKQAAATVAEGNAAIQSSAEGADNGVAGLGRSLAFTEEQAKAFNAALVADQRARDQSFDKAQRSAQTLNRILTQQTAILGGPAAAAALTYRDELTELLEIENALNEAGLLSSDVVAGLAQARSNAAALFNKEMQEAAEATDETARAVDELLRVFESPFSRMTKDLALLRRELEKADKPMAELFDPERVKALREAVNQVEHSMNVAMISATQEGLRSLQSMTESGSKAFAAFQVAIDALSVAQAISAVLNQGNGDPYTAFARMAAMAAAVAQLVGNIGANFGGSNGFTDTAAERQRTQGTGTLLGDSESQSQSIITSSKITADATSELVGINRGMLRALTALQGGIDRAGGMLARGAGQADFTEIGGRFDVGGAFLGGLFGSQATRMLDPLNLLGGTSRITDQGLAIGGGGLGDINVQAYQEQQYRRWRFGSRRTRDELAPVGEEFQSQFQLIVDSIVTTVREGALALGLLPEEIEAALAAFRLEETRISLKDLSAEEQQAELLAVFSAIFDGLAGDVVPFIEQFQRLGEGLGETLVRVATGVQVTREAVARLGFALDETDPEKFAQISEGLIAASGGLDAFITGMQSFVDNFAPESYRLAIAQNDLTRAFAEVGLAVPATREGMWALMQSLDATTESGQAQIATLLRLADTSEAYYSMLERERELQLRMVEEQIAALMDYEATAQSVRDELAESGMSSFAIELRNINRWVEDVTRELNETARAAGLQAAAEEDLAAVHEVASLRAAAAISRLMGAAGQLVNRLFGSSTERLDARIAELEAAQQSQQQSQLDGINAVGEAATNVYEQQLASLQSISEWLNSQLLGDTSTLTPEQRVQEARRQFEADLGLAQQGDTAALARITRSAETLLREGRDFWASGQNFTDLEAFVRGSLQGLVATGPLATPSVSTGGGGGPGGNGTYSVAPSPELQALYEERDALRAQIEQEERQALLQELGGMIRELVQATGWPLEEIAAALDLNITDLVTSLGINLEELSAETAASLIQVARQLGVDVGELADSVGVSLGSLADRQSLLNQALDQTLESIPQEFRDRLAGPLEAIRTATTEADARQALDELTEVSGDLPAGIRDLLAPYFDNIDPTEVVTQLGTLRDISEFAERQLAVLNNIELAIREGTVEQTTAVANATANNGSSSSPETVEATRSVNNSVEALREDVRSGNDGVVQELRLLRELINQR
ncbi:tail length tape-measure protein [Microcystis phage Me-ZS1]|nr:tail length tape-measure protein [Microcystis phage Me-ZS1]